MFLDYETLRVIWWGLLGILLIGFAVMDGFDLGVAIWLPWVGKSDMERRIMIRTIAPTWEGNQVWFILGGGAIFAAWPTLYAVSFSGFYLAMLVVLLALVIRPVGLKYRSKLENSRWRSCWDIALFLSGLIPSLIFGVAIGNAIEGVPFHFDESMRSFYTGTFFELLNPFALFCGLVSVCMLSMQGAFFLLVKTEGIIQQRSKIMATISATFVCVLFGLAGLWVYYRINGYQLNGIVPHDGPSNPLYKNAIKITGAWFNNYKEMPITLLAPIIGLLFPIIAILLKKHAKIAFVCSSLSVIGIIGTVGVSMFPFILPSSSNPAQSLTVWDSSSSQLTLMIMLFATVIFLPIILAYTTWVYRVLRGKITQETVIANQDLGY